MVKFILHTIAGSLLLLYSGTAFTGSYQMGDASLQWLGNGIESNSGVLKGSCLTGNVVRYNNEKLSLGLQNKQSVASSIREIDGTVSGDVNLGLFAGGATVQLHSRMVESENTISVVLRIHYTGNTYRLENRRYTEFAESLIGQPLDNIFAACGDQYIDHIQLGNDLYFTSQLVFQDKEEYRKFVRKIRVRVLFFKTEHTRSEEFYDYAKNARYSIKVLSNHSLPSFITSQLGDSDELHCGADSASNMALCDQASSAIMDYFLREDGYSAWLNNEDNLGITFIKSSRYDKTGHPEFAEVKPLMIQQWLALQSELRVLLEQQYQLLNRYQSYAEVPVAGQSSAVAIRGTIQSNIGWLEQAQNDCLQAYLEGSITQCRQAINDARQQQQAIP